MKSDVFNQYVERITNLFHISKEDLFTKSKKRHLVDARQLLYYLCHRRQIQQIYIHTYMMNNGYKIEHSSVTHGIRMVEKRIKEDSDYLTVIKNLEKSVFI